MKNLILLAVLAAGTFDAAQPELPVGHALDGVPDDIADKLIKDGVAKLAEPEKSDKAGKATKKTPVRVLADCQHGKVNDVVELDATALKIAEDAGLVDSNKAAVAYAQTLDQNKPKKAKGDDAL